jgi:CDP-diglyceride synthetase
VDCAFVGIDIIIIELSYYNCTKFNYFEKITIRLKITMSTNNYIAKIDSIYLQVTVDAITFLHICSGLLNWLDLKMTAVTVTIYL